MVGEGKWVIILKLYSISCRIIAACKAVIYYISLITRNDFRIQLKAIKILTETNRKTDGSWWLKTLHHPKGPSNSMSPSSNSRSWSSKLKGQVLRGHWPGGHDMVSTVFINWGPQNWRGSHIRGTEKSMECKEKGTIFQTNAWCSPCGFSMKPGSAIGETQGSFRS